jgi:2-dehydro-3-deoxygluconokinase
MKGDVVTFGEMLLRLSPPGYLRLGQAHYLDLVYGGAEANVAVALATWGLPVQYLTRLPKNDLGAACLGYLRGHGVGCDFIQRGGHRLGLYFLEAGAGLRPSRVIYDRAHSSFATIAEDEIDWPEVFASAGWFHWSGISPAVSAAAAQATSRAVAAARAAGLTISCDLNYRHSLWQWGQPPSAVMPDLIAQCDLLAANAASPMLDLPDLPLGRTPDEAAAACTQLVTRYPNLKQVAMTCRQTTSAGQQSYTAVFWQTGQLYTSPTFALAPIVDRVGAGDAFMAGLIYGLQTFPGHPQRIVSFAAASAALKHTISGDALLATIADVEQLLGPHGFDIVR